MAASPVTFPSYIHPGMEPRVALFTVLVTAAAGLVLGLAPALQVRAGNLQDAFKQSVAQTSVGRGGRRFRGVLVVAEVAFAALLLIGAGLMNRSLRELAAIDLGYDIAHVLTLRAILPRQSVPNLREILRKLSQLPAVESVAASIDVPLTGYSAAFYSAEGQPPVTAQNAPRAYVHRVSPAFFRTLDMRLIAGRTFQENELNPNSNVTIATEAVVCRFWPGQDPIGKPVKFGSLNSQNPWLTIVGVVRELKCRSLPENPTNDPDLFLPMTERPGLALLVRTTLDPSSTVPAVRRTLREAEPGAVIYNVAPLSVLASRETARSRLTGRLMGIFAVCALLLAMIGIYGVMSYAVTRRAQEIGIRMALGAARGEVLRLVVANGMSLIGMGLSLGVAALALTRLIGTLLYGVRPTDPLAFARAALALAAVPWWHA